VLDRHGGGLARSHPGDGSGVYLFRPRRPRSHGVGHAAGGGLRWLRHLACLAGADHSLSARRLSRGGLPLVPEVTHFQGRVCASRSLQAQGGVAIICWCEPRVRLKLKGRILWPNTTTGMRRLLLRAPALRSTKACAPICCRSTTTWRGASRSPASSHTSCSRMP